MPAVRPDTVAGDFYGDEDIIAAAGHPTITTVEAVIFTAVIAILPGEFVLTVAVQVHMAFGWTGTVVLGAMAATGVAACLNCPEAHR